MGFRPYRAELWGTVRMGGIQPNSDRLDVKACHSHHRNASLRDAQRLFGGGGGDAQSLSIPACRARRPA